MELSIFLHSNRHVTSIVATPIAPPETLPFDILFINLKTTGLIFETLPESVFAGGIISATAGITKVAASRIFPYINLSPLSLKNIPENKIVIASIGPIASSVAYDSDDACTNTRFLRIPFIVVTIILNRTTPNPASPFFSE